tara:strand:- start:2100 stop:2384 length:285 start_codon:yes stop_codon:yes gene_type:complete
MYILALKDDSDEGAYAVQNDDGEQVVFFFEDEDDAIRYNGLLEAEDYPEMGIVEVDPEVAVKTCDMYDYKYAIITTNDFVIPPRDDYIPENSVS